MDYTYKDFLESAMKDGEIRNYGKEELEQVRRNPEYGLGTLTARKKIENAKTPEQKMMGQMVLDQLNKAYKPVEQITFGKPFHWGGEEQFNGLVDRVINRPEFSYDAARDPDYSAYRKQMLREGDRVQRNTMTRAANMTGGVPSSWAVTAASMAGNENAAKIADAQPSFHQQALGKYMKDRQMDLAALDVLTKERANAYQMYMQNLQNAMRLYQMGQWTPEIAEALGLPWAPREEPSSSGGGVYVGGPAPETTGSPELELDRKSVLNLGMGPLSGGYLAGLVNDGKVNEKVQGDKIHVSWPKHPGTLPTFGKRDKYKEFYR